MKNAIPAIMIAALLISSRCGQVEKADLAIVNARVFTVDKQAPYAEAIAVKEGIIVAVGSNKKIAKYVDHGKTRVIDAAGRSVIPGFNDAHAHFGPVDPDFIELRYVTDPAVITDKVREQAARIEKGHLIYGGHWEHEMFTTREWPSKKLIDAVSPDNPVVLRRTDGHSALVNSYVLRESGINRDTPDPFGGEIMKDPVTGEPTGILKESAMALIKTDGKKVQRSAEEEREREWRGYITALQQAAGYGITSIQIPGSADFEMYDTIMAKGLLTCRIDIGAELTADQDKLERYNMLRNKYPSSGNWIRFGYLKDFMDGTLGSATAMMFEPFDDDPGNTGLPQLSYEELEERVITADRLGFQIGIHAIGPKANNWILNAFQKAREVNGVRDSRHRSEHAQILIEEDIPRFAELGVIASMQPTHCITDKRFAEKRIGTDRSRWSYAWKSLADSGAQVAFGTDYSVEPLNPMEGLYAAVTRKDRKGEEGEGWFPMEKLTMEKAIEYYTLGASFAQFTEERKGMLKPGYLADITVLSEDIFSTPEDRIMTVKTDYTITDGKIVFERK
ncbi:MAG: amidohydrolase [Bacteroidales bacterium]|nr:amidohydrolase [Bacteroidales bacterium]